MSVTKRGRRRILIGILGAGLVIGLLGPASAQEGDSLPDPLEPFPRDEASASLPIDDGNYAGMVGMGGSFWFSEEGISVVWTGSSSGPLEFGVVDGELTGQWSTAGMADITGSGLASGMSGANTWTMGGTVAGSDPYVMEGSGSGVTSVVAAGRTSESQYSIPPSAAPWEGVIQHCGQVVGNWDQAIDTAMEGAPLQHSLKSYFAVFSSDFSTELEAQIQVLIEDATRLQQDISVQAVLLSGDLAGVLLRAEELMEQIESEPEGCAGDPSFMRVITQIVQDIANTFLNNWSRESPDTLQINGLRRLVEIGLRAGAIGAGEAGSGIGLFLETKAEQVLQRQFDAVTAQDPIDYSDITQMAVTATLLGYTFDSGLSGRDMCLKEC